MFKIHDDKVYFVAETPNINKVIEIFLPKDDRGTIMDSHEIRVDLCRAVIHMEKKGIRVLKVRNIEDTNKASIDIWHMPEYQEAAESPVSDVVNACIESCFDSGAMFNLPCKANRKTHEVFAVECCASPDDDDSFSHADVEIDGQSYPLNFVSDIMDENDVNNALDEFYRIQQTGEYWEAHDGKSLTDAIHECRWAILKDAIQKRGHEAVADFVGTDISSDTYDRVMDETEAQMPDEEFERFWEKYNLTCSMASPLNNRCFYGANTTNEWVVREYIKDKENNPTIYNGLPLHTEYRVFVDFDTKEILGASPYWRSDVMKNEFKKVSSPQERHDYVVYKMHEDILNQRYHESVQTVLAELKKVIPRIELTGQWSVDVMRNGNDYYIIDMALAENSALNDCVPKNLLRAYPQQWLPGESNS